MVQLYKSKFNFLVRWIPEQENIAYQGLTGTPPLKSSVDIKFDIKHHDEISDRQGGTLSM
jgi:hypothetical protein